LNGKIGEPIPKPGCVIGNVDDKILYSGILESHINFHDQSYKSEP